MPPVIVTKPAGVPDVTVLLKPAPELKMVTPVSCPAELTVAEPVAEVVLALLFMVTPLLSTYVKAGCEMLTIWPFVKPEPPAVTVKLVITLFA